MSEDIPAFSVEEPLCTARAKAEKLCLGHSREAILKALGRGPYRKVSLLDLSQLNAPLLAAEGLRERQAHAAELVHVLITHRPRRRWSRRKQRLSFFLKMSDGCCRSVIAVSTPSH